MVRTPTRLSCRALERTLTRAGHPPARSGAGGFTLRSYADLGWVTVRHESAPAKPTLSRRRTRAGQKVEAPSADEPLAGYRVSLERAGYRVDLLGTADRTYLIVQLPLTSPDQDRAAPTRGPHGVGSTCARR